MSALPRVPHVASVAIVKKSLSPVAIPLREKKLNKETVRQDWQDAVQKPNQSFCEALVIPVGSLLDQQGTDDSEQSQDEKNPRNETVLSDSLALGRNAAVAAGQAGYESLPLNMNRLGGLIAAFVVHAVVHGAWAVQIPLAHELLQETVLHMRCEQAILTLRFETSDWRSRETLMQYAPLLLQRLRQTLPQLMDVILLTD